MGEEGRKTTMADVGKGMVLLGMILLILMAAFYVLSKVQDVQYGLFSGTVHLYFDAALGLALLIIGLLIVKRESIKNQSD